MAGKSQPKRYRWSCASPDHPGILAPSRLRLIDLRRYCIPCSIESGVLVERTCPALDKQRETKDEQRKVQARRATQSRRARQEAYVRQKDRRRAARATAVLEAVGDLRAELDRLWPIVRDVSPRDDLPVESPAMRIGTRTRESFVSGYAWYREHRIFVGVPKTADHAEGCGTLAHELAHLAAAGREEGHHPAFWVVLVDIVRKAYDATITAADVLREPTKYLRQQAVEQSIRDARGRAGLL
jgi:hypothetical protein